MTANIYIPEYPHLHLSYLRVYKIQPLCRLTPTDTNVLREKNQYTGNHVRHDCQQTDTSKSLTSSYFSTKTPTSAIKNINKVFARGQCKFPSILKLKLISNFVLSAFSSSISFTFWCSTCLVSSSLQTSSNSF